MFEVFQGMDQLTLGLIGFVCLVGPSWVIIHIVSKYLKATRGDEDGEHK